MRSYLLALCAFSLPTLTMAENLTDADREALLEKIDALRANANDRVNAKFRVAVQAFNAAIASDDAAFDLYLKCVEKVDFEDMKKKGMDFREWKRKEDEKISKPSFRLALRHQLRWLVLTLQATDPETDRMKLAPQAQDIVDAVFRDAEKLRDQQTVLKQGVMETVFAKAYELSGLKVDKWPLSPVNLQQVYEQVLFPPARSSFNPPVLKAAWIKRMQQEGTIQEFWTGPPPREGGKDGRGGDKDKEPARIGMADEMRPPEYEKFLETTLPMLQWQMEMDLYKHGDQSGAALRMLQHLEKHVGHPSVREWTEQFRVLLTPEPKPAAAAK